MNIIELIKSEPGVRVTAKSDTWIMYDNDTGEWVTYHWLYAAKKVRELYRGDSEALAVKAAQNE